MCDEKIYFFTSTGAVKFLRKKGKHVVNNDDIEKSREFRRIYSKKDLQYFFKKFSENIFQNILEKYKEFLKSNPTANCWMMVS